VSQVEQHFATELATLSSSGRRAAAEAIAATLSIDSIEYLRHVRGLDRSASSSVLRAAMNGILH
jgi:hypothetical protein